MTVVEDRARRARETVAVLLERGSLDTPVKLADVWQEVERRVPVLPEDAALNESGKSKANTAWRWSTADLARAGWIRKGPEGGLWYPTETSKSALEDFQDPVKFLIEARARYSAWSKAKKETQRKLLSTGIAPRNANEERIREVASLFVVNGLQAGESVFTAGRSIWNKSTAEELVEHFVGSADETDRSFVDKLADQLGSVSDDARLLMAELVTWQLLPIHSGSIGEAKKAQRVEAILRTMTHPVKIPDAVLKVLSTGVYNPGTRMSSNLFPAMSIIVRLVHQWFTLSSDEREALLEEPLRWREFVMGVPGENFPTQRNSLLYSVLPEYFGPIVSEDHKSRVRAAFVGEIGEATDDIDRDLYDITVALQIKDDGPVNFYDSPYKERWDTPDEDQTSIVMSTGEDEDEAEPSVAVRTQFPSVTPDLSEQLNIDEPWLQKTLSLLERRGQVILYGPPGTGKTYLARALAQHIVEDPSQYTLVQFHPSYSYEDFFEGFRPVVNDEGSLVYELRSGPMKRVAQKALANREANYVVIIDEINRGNLAKIFGELYFLLEYRDEAVSLLYGGEDVFTLPDNVFFIGTMNTSDRSIALMDAAMRRRFAFVELHPTEPPVANVLPRWLAKNGLDSEPAALLDAVNERIAEEAFRIGPSYLMDKELSAARLEEIWDHEILPLLDEYHYGDGTDVRARYGLPVIRRALLDTSPDQPIPETAGDAGTP